MSLYAITLVSHSHLRWAVVLLLGVVVLRAAHGSARDRPWSPLDERLHRLLVGCTDLQFALGLLLYAVLSPISSAFFADAKGAMHDVALRFFGVEHVASMVLAVTAVHVGRARAKKAPSDQLRHRRTLSWTLGALLLVLVGVPWPFLRYGRPLIRRSPESAVTAQTMSSSTVACPPTYKTRCATCHGDSGRGDGLAAANLKPLPRNFTDAAWSASRTEAALVGVIREGGRAHGLSVAMPAHDDLPNTELAALARCVQSFSAGR